MSKPDAQPACPKCGHDEYRMRYVEPVVGTGKQWLQAVACRTDEYMRYRCHRCRYTWQGECLDAKAGEAAVSGLRRTEMDPLGILDASDCFARAFSGEKRR